MAKTFSTVSADAEVVLTHKGEAYCESFRPTWRGQPIPATRAAIESEIERLIELLDVVDGDQDFEPDLGWCSDGNNPVPDTDHPSDDLEADYIEFSAGGVCVGRGADGLQMEDFT